MTGPSGRVGAGLQAVETCEVVVERTFACFEEYWATSTITGGVRPPLDAMTADERASLKARDGAYPPIPWVVSRAVPAPMP